jgi:hypothetical protein
MESPIDGPQCCPCDLQFASPLGTHEPGAHDGWPYEKTPPKLANRNAMKSGVLTIHSRCMK